MKIKQIDTTSAIAWSFDGIPLLATGSIADTIDFDAPTSAVLQIWNAVGLPQESPVFSAEVEHKFHALAWLRPLEGRPRGVLVGAFANGVVEFWDVDQIFRTTSLAAASIHKYTGELPIKCLRFNPLQPHILATGGQKAQILIWNVLTFATPESPGTPISPMDNITSLAWNNVQGSILASTSSLGYTSIWDLKQKRELLHLLYVGTSGKADFSQVAWHPSELTKLATASQSDMCPVIMTWNLRTPQEPEKIMHGHTKGVLSLDWCAQDHNLLISAGKDNCVRLWNPVLGIKLGDYPTTANWAFLTQFAPRAPDIFATASFDGKVIVQTLQDTSPPVSEKVQARDDNEFWTSITNVETQQAVFEVKQAPKWLKRPVSASFGFGSKIIVVKNSDNRGIIEIKNFTSTQGNSTATSELSAAFKSNDFLAILATHLQQQTSDSADWQLLNQLNLEGKQQFLKLVLGNNEVKSPELDNAINNNSSILEDKLLNDDDFFSNLSIEPTASITLTAKFSPSGPFTLPEIKESPDGRLARFLMRNEISKAVDVCLQEGKLMEALVLALDQEGSVKDKVRNHFFQSAGSSTLSRLIFAASSQEISDIIKNANIDDWKDVAGSINAFCVVESEDFNAKFIELGDRILANGSDKTSRDNALYCYLAGSALDKVSSIWLQELSMIEQEILNTPGNDVSNLYEARYLALNNFTQKVTVYRSILNITGPVSGKSIEETCKAIGDFAMMTSSNGDFELASKLMALLPDDFSGVKDEKDRIAMALRPVQKANQRNQPLAAYGNGYSQSTHRNQPVNRNQFGASAYGNNAPNGVSLTNNSYVSHLNSYASPAQMRNISVPSTRSTPRTSVDHGSGFRQASYSAASVARSTAQPINTYQPKQAQETSFGNGTMQQGQYVYGKSSTATPVAYPQTTGYAASAMDPPLLPHGSKHKTDTDGWNDLPDLFKAPSKPAPRRTPAPQMPQPQPSATISTPASMAPPPIVSAAVPPPPPPVSSTRSRRSSQASNRGFVGSKTPLTRPQVERVSSKYAPPVPAITPSTLVNGNANDYFEPAKYAQAPKPVAAPKNPYEPKPQQAHPDAPVPPIVPGFGAAAANTSVNKLTTAPCPPVNPYAVPQNAANFAPPSPGVVSFGSGTNATRPPPPQVSYPPKKAPVNPYANTQSQGNNSGYPTSRAPSSHSVLPPPRAPSTVHANNMIPPPQVHHNTQSSGPTQSPYAPPNKPLAVQTPSSMTPPPRFAPPAQQNPSSSHVPPPPPPAQQSAQNQVTHRASISSSVPARSRAASHQSTVSHAPLMNGASSVEVSSLQQQLDNLLSDVKRVAPPKYGKHISDMEKRFNLLFSHLRKGELVSGTTVSILAQICAALVAKDFSAAGRLNSEIMEKHASELGEWNVGVKRLIAMSEALKDSDGR